MGCTESRTSNANRKFSEATTENRLKKGQDFSPDVEVLTRSPPQTTILGLKPKSFKTRRQLSKPLSPILQNAPPRTELDAIIELSRARRLETWLHMIDDGESDVEGSTDDDDVDNAERTHCPPVRRRKSGYFVSQQASLPPCQYQRSLVETLMRIDVDSFEVEGGLLSPEKKSQPHWWDTLAQCSANPSAEHKAIDAGGSPVSDQGP